MSKQNTGRKFFATAATAALVASAIVPVASAAEFTDADQIASWAKEAVEALAAKEVITGNPDGSFNPAGTVTRAQAAKMFSVALGLDTEGTEDFADVKDGQWFQEYVVAVVNAGIVNGMTATEFAPNGKLTREQAAKMIVEAYGLEGEADLSEFADAKTVAGKWSEGYLSTAVANGVINGKGDKLAATDSISRQEFAVMLTRAIDVDSVDYAAELTNALTALDEAVNALKTEVKVEEIEAAKAGVTTAETAIVTVETALEAAKDVVTEEEATKAKEAIASAKKAVETTKAAIAKAEEAAKELTIQSVTAINAKQIEVKFSTAVKSTELIESADNTLVNGKLTVSSLDEKAVTINNAKAVLSEDGKTLTLTVSGSEVLQGRYDVKVAAGAFKAANNKEINKFETTIVAKDVVAPSIVTTEKINATKFKVKFSEPMQTLGNVTFKVGEKTITAGAQGIVTTFVPGNDYAEFTIGTDVEVGQAVEAKFVGALDYAGLAITPNPATTTFVKGAKDGIAPQVSNVTVVSGKTLEVKFTEELASVPTITIAGTTATVKQDKTDKTKYVATLATAVTGIKTVVVSNMTDLSGEVQTKNFSQAVNFSVDTTAPKVVSTTIEVGQDNKQYLVVTFDENIEKTTATIAVSGKKTKNYITSTFNNSVVNADILVNEDNKKIVKIALDKVLGTTNDEEGAVYDLTLVGNVALVKDESGNVGPTEVKTSFTRGKDGSASTIAQAEIDTTFDLNGVKLVDNKTLKVTFKNAVDGKTATNTANYVVAGYPVAKAELADDEKTVTLTLADQSITETGARTITISNVKAKNGTAMDVYTTTELLNDNVVPTLNGQKVTGVTTGSALVPAVNASTKNVVVTKADSSEETTVTVSVTAQFGSDLTGVTFEHDGTNWTTTNTDIQLSDVTIDGNTNPFAAGDKVVFDVVKYTAEVPAVSAATTVELTFNEAVMNGSQTDFELFIKGVKVDGVTVSSNTVTNANASKELVVTIGQALTTAQFTDGVELRPVTNTIDISDVDGNVVKFENPIKLELK